MAGSLYNANNVVVGHAMMMITPWVPSAVKPIVADGTPLFSPEHANWGTDWVSVGATNEGFKTNVETSTTQVTIEEQSTPVAETVESKGLSIEASLAESTMETIRLSWGGSAITVSATKKTMTLSDTLNYYTVILETRNFLGFARRFYVPKMSISGSGEVSFRRAADKQMFPIRAASLSAPSEIQIVDYLSA